MYFVLGISITLAALLIANVLIASIATGLWSAFAGRLARLSAGVQAEIVFALRAFPVVASLALVFGYIVPAYLLLEPRESGEVVSRKMAVIAGASSIAVMLSLYRVAASWLATRRLVRTWMRGSERVSLNAAVPVFRIAHNFPIIAVTGILRPRMFIAAKVINSLDPDELTAAIAHEYGHLAAGDNLKRTFLRFCRDLIIFPVGKTLDRDWCDLAESAADDFAAGAGRKRALDLASALIKITRIVPSGVATPMPAGSFFLGDKGGDVTARVKRLMNGSRTSSDSPAPRPMASICLWSAGVLILLLLPFFDSRLYASTHGWIETFVRVLQ